MSLTENEKGGLTVRKDKREETLGWGTVSGVELFENWFFLEIYILILIAESWIIRHRDKRSHEISEQRCWRMGNNVTAGDLTTT